ncbi:glycoside hydrolase family 16 protein [Shivajiella indica]|uniref:Family 16 glycosylhydrolase n=1 Tax=Shivajiella indica TaxID=872115 RepID=A0ABW5BAN8_9BACT
MNKIKFLHYLIIFSFFFYSCGEGEDTVVEPLPSGLEVLISKEANGLVRLTLQAANTNYFMVNFGIPNSDWIRVNGNEVTYSYTDPGRYNIAVQAHSSESKFITAFSIITMSNSDLGFEFPQSGFESPLEYEGYQMVWNDEFEGNTLSEDWVFEIGDGCPALCGWGNNELQYYRRENTEVRDGYLIIKALQENFGGKNFTSSRIKTQGKKSFKYGRIDIRAALPKGQGLWPALWMLGDNITEVGWPFCGEIDIMEMVGGSQDGKDNTVHGTVHWASNGNWANYGGSKRLDQGILNDKFHVFSIVWDEGKIVWLLDNVAFHEIDTTPQDLNEFRESFFFLFNVAVGGNWPGSPDGTTEFPQQMAVDYVRVFQKN